MQKKSDNSFQEYLVCSLYCLLMRYFSDEINGGSIHAERQDFYEIVTYINEHYEDNINVNMLEETLFLYRAKMSRIFLKFAGMSIKEYIYMLRIKKANSLMNQGYGVTQAAMESGFGSIRTFNYVYKKMMGFKPSQYANKK